MIAQLSGAFHSIMQNLRYNADAAGMDDAGIRDMKVALLRDEAEALVEKGLCNSFEIVQSLLEGDMKTPPTVVGEAEIRRIVSTVVAIKSLELGRSGDLASGTEKLFLAAEKQAQEQRGIEPVRLGIPRIDDALQSGMYPGSVLGLTGHEGSLKSSVALHLIEENVWKNPACRCLFCSLDMNADMLMHRRVSRFLGIHEVRARELFAEQNADYLKARSEIARRDDGRLFVLSSPCTIADIEAAMGTCLPTLTVVDYVMLVSVAGERDKFRAFERVLEKIREWRSTTKATFVLLSQMSRQSKAEAKSGKSGSHAYGGGVFEQLLDVELELCLDAPVEEGIDAPRLVVTINKNRFGPQGKQFEVEHDGPSKRITGKSWRLDRAKEQKPVFGGRSQF